MMIDARNQLQGVVKKIKKGKVMCSVRVEIPAGGRMGVAAKAVNALLIQEEAAARAPTLDSAAGRTSRRRQNLNHRFPGH
jgi:molybdopterin-binding protein